MQKEIDFLELFFKEAITRITTNLRTMTDSKGHNRYASGVTAQEVSQPDNLQIAEYVEKWVIQIFMPYYYEYIDEGVKGWANKKNNTGKFKFKKSGKPIPRQAILQFMRNRAIVYKGYKGDKKAKKKKSISDKLNNLAWLIGRKIKREGVEQFPFYSSVMTNEFFGGLENKFIDMYGDNLLDDITLFFKNKN